MNRVQSIGQQVRIALRMVRLFFPVSVACLSFRIEHQLRQDRFAWIGRSKVWSLAAIICLLVGIASPARADGALRPVRAVESGIDDAYCAPNAATDGYVGASEMVALRADASKESSGAAFAGLRDEDKVVVAEALRIGPTGGVFSARLLRDMALIEAFERQSACGQVGCPKPAIVAGFKTGERGDPNADKSWGDLISLWKGFRDGDAVKARACLQAARSRPDFVVAVASAEPPPAAKAVAVAEPPSAPAAAPAVVASPLEQATAAVAGGAQVAAASLLPDRNQAASCRDGVAAAIGGRWIRFERASSRVAPGDLEFLGKLGEIAQTCGDAKLVLEGHTDADGSDRYNRRLSHQRAEAVAKAMGVTGPSGRVAVEGLGKAGAVARNDSRVHKAMNRRVEIRVL